MQEAVALSTTKAKYITLKESLKETIYLCKLIKSAKEYLALDIPNKIPIILEDN